MNFYYVAVITTVKVKCHLCYPLQSQNRQAVFYCQNLNQFCCLKMYRSVVTKFCHWYLALVSTTDLERDWSCGQHLQAQVMHLTAFQLWNLGLRILWLQDRQLRIIHQQAAGALMVFASYNMWSQTLEWELSKDFLFRFPLTFPLTGSRRVSGLWERAQSFLWSSSLLRPLVQWLWSQDFPHHCFLLSNVPLTRMEWLVWKSTACLTEVLEVFYWRWHDWNRPI